MNSYIKYGLAVLATAIIIGGGTYAVVQSKANSDKTGLNNNISALTSDKTTLQSSVTSLTAQLAAAKSTTSPSTTTTTAVAGLVAPHDIQISYNSSKTLATITTDGKQTGTINTTSSGTVRIFGQNNSDAYLFVPPSGVGGYILYSDSIPMTAVYQVNFTKNTLNKLSINLINDISVSGRYLAYLSNDGTKISIGLYDTQTNTEKTYPIDAKYTQAGDIKFSPNEQKIAYAATIANPDNSSAETTDVYIINLSTGAQTKQNPSNTTPSSFVYWQDNNSLVINGQ